MGTIILIKARAERGRSRFIYDKHVSFPVVSGRILGVDWVIDAMIFFRDHSSSFHFHSFPIAFFLGFISSFKSYCSRAQVVGRTLVHEFHIYASHL